MQFNSEYIMNKARILINSQSNTPKYLQIVNSIKELIRNNSLVIGNALPSVRQFSAENNLSQETVIKAYNELKSLGVLKSELRKGYFVASNKINYKKNIFLLFDELSEYKKILYNAIRSGIDSENTRIEVFFHHCNAELFETLISKNIDNFNYFIIMPFENKKISATISKLRNKRVLFLDRKEYIDETRDHFISQDFNNSVGDCLQSAISLIKNYKIFTLIFPETDSVISNASKAPKEIKLGFIQFCKKNAIDYKIVDQVKKVHLKEAFFVIDDMDIVTIIKIGKRKGYQLGREIGLISFNEAPIKEVVSEGITTISANYKQMGEDVVSYINEEKKEVQQIVSTELIIRNSL